MMMRQILLFAKRFSRATIFFCHRFFESKKFSLKKGRKKSFGRERNLLEGEEIFWEGKKCFC